LTDLRPYAPGDHEPVRALFIAVNRALAPPEMKDAFERYIEKSLTQEIDRIEAYYDAHDGCFMVAIREGRLAGMFGLERVGQDSMELRRMYVSADRRRMGIGQFMLGNAERLARSRGARLLLLSTSELQPAALALYRASGFTQTKVDIAMAATNKTVGSGIRRFHFEKSFS
jgi:GNAT superfamily N-acetyltransferase